MDLYCMALNYPAGHYIILHCTALPGTLIPFRVIKYPGGHCTALQGHLIPYRELQCNVGH